MIDSTALRSELVNDPESLGYATFVASGDDSALVALLNAVSFRGYVPIVELASYCAVNGVTGTVLALIETPIGTGGMTLPFKALLHTVLTLIQTDFRLSIADVDSPAFGAALDGLATAGVITDGQKADMLALGANRRSRAEVLFGDGLAVTGSDVSFSLRGTR